jgi:hypothetical protein
MIAFDIDSNVLWAMGGLYVILFIASIVLWLMKRRARPKTSPS